MKSPLIIALICASAAVAVVAFARSHGAEDTSGKSSPAANPGATGSGSIAGLVTYRGPALAPPRATTFAPECGKVSPPPPFDADHVAGAFVWIEQGLPPGNYPVPAQPVELDQRGCEYSPRVFGIRAGQSLLIVNNDALLHNVHALGEGAGLLGGGGNAFNVAMPVQGMKVTRRFDKEQIPVTITCDVHPWMRAYAAVVDTPFFAVTAPDGSFRIGGLPAGNYLVGVWQERLGKSEGRIAVAGGQGAKLDLAFVR